MSILLNSLFQAFLQFYHHTAFCSLFMNLAGPFCAFGSVHSTEPVIFVFDFFNQEKVLELVHAKF